MVYLVCVESGGNHISLIIRRVSGMSMMAQLFFFVFPVQQPLGQTRIIEVGTLGELYALLG